MRIDRTTLGIAGAAGALLVGGGTALAAKDGDGSATTCQARLAKIAERRGVTVAQLEAAVKARLLARVDAALAAGRITADRAATLRARITSVEPCTGRLRKAVGARVRHRLVVRASHYLGLTPAELRAELPGTSLAALAVKHGKSAEGLEAALLAPARTRLAKAVSAGRISQARADARHAKLEHRVQRLVARTFPPM